MNKINYEIEVYDLKKEIGLNVIEETEDIFEAIKTASKYFNELCSSDKKHTAILVNRYINEEYDGSIFEFNKHSEELKASFNEYIEEYQKEYPDFPINNYVIDSFLSDTDNTNINDKDILKNYLYLELNL